MEMLIRRFHTTFRLEQKKRMVACPQLTLVTLFMDGSRLRPLTCLRHCSQFILVFLIKSTLISDTVFFADITSHALEITAATQVPVYGKTKMLTRINLNITKRIYSARNAFFYLYS